MSLQAQIREALLDLGGKVGPIQTLLVKVVSVNEGEMTCVVDDDGHQITDVRLRPVLNGKEAMTLFPKVGVWALVTRIEEDSEWMVIACDEVDKARLKVGSCELEMDGSKFIFKKGAESMKKLFDDLFTAMLSEIHLTSTGPTTGLNPGSVTAYNNLKARFDAFFGG